MLRAEGESWCGTICEPPQPRCSGHCLSTESDSGQGLELDREDLPDLLQGPPTLLTTPQLGSLKEAAALNDSPEEAAAQLSRRAEPTWEGCV